MQLKFIWYSLFTQSSFFSTLPDVTIATHINDKALKEIKIVL